MLNFEYCLWYSQDVTFHPPHPPAAPHFQLAFLPKALNLGSIALKFKHVFGNVRILATDPNYYFISQKTASREARVSTVEDVFAAVSTDVFCFIFEGGVRGHCLGGAPLLY